MSEPPAADWGEEDLDRWRARLKELGPAARLGVDTGGTFTDFVLAAEGSIETWKEPSRPDDPARPIREVLEAPAGRRAAVASLFVGTTVGTNAVLERKGARVGLITTAGFEDLLDLARQTRSSLYALNPPVSPPLVPRDLRFGVEERLNPDGSVESALDARRLEDIVRRVEASGVEAVAVLFLHSIRNDSHERLVFDALREASPRLPVSLSSRVLPEPREYERLVATVLNAGLGPVFQRYLGGLEAGERPVGVAVSSGGILPASLAAGEPVRTILSGPAAGSVAAHRLAREMELGPLLTLDMGGTSTDVSWVDPGRDLPLTTDGVVGGWPIALPSVDVVTVGAGGGSVARLDAAGALVVGPESAGADPGPAAYGRGGPATLTDALLVLGLLPAEIPLAGGIRLDRQAAVEAVAPLASALGGSVEETAAAAARVALARMERALRKVSSARGHDPRRAALLAYGGAGGLLAVELARRLGMSRVIVPPSPGVFSAWGTLAAPARLDRSRPVRMAARDLDGGSPFMPFWAWLGAFVPALAGESGFHCSFGARYPGQSRDLLIPAGGEWEEHFHAEHERRAGYARPEVRPVITTLRLSLRYAGAAPPLPEPGEPAGTPGPPRRVVFPDGEVREVPVVSRTSLSPSSPVPGPLLVAERGAVVVVPPDARALVGGGGILILETGRATSR